MWSKKRTKHKQRLFEHHKRELHTRRLLRDRARKAQILRWIACQRRSRAQQLWVNSSLAKVINSPRAITHETSFCKIRPVLVELYSVCVTPGCPTGRPGWVKNRRWAGQGQVQPTTRRAFGQNGYPFLDSSGYLHKTLIRIHRLAADEKHTQHSEVSKFTLLSLHFERTRGNESLRARRTMSKIRRSATKASCITSANVLKKDRVWQHIRFSSQWLIPGSKGRCSQPGKWPKKSTNHPFRAWSWWKTKANKSIEAIVPPLACSVRHQEEAF